MTAILQAEHHWVCPNCTATDVTHEPDPHTRMHSCKGMRGFNVPMVQDGTKCKVYSVERADYIGKELVQVDGEGRPIMSVITERNDGQDCAVYAPTAFATREIL